MRRSGAESTKDLAAANADAVVAVASTTTWTGTRTDRREAGWSVSAVRTACHGCHSLSNLHLASRVSCLAFALQHLRTYIFA